jgi:Peptidase family M28
LRIAIYRITDLGPDACLPLTKLPVGFARFGDEVLIYTSNSKWHALMEFAEMAGIALSVLPWDLEREELYLVIQVGDPFSREHQDAVVLNKGRYLAVALEPERARHLLATKSRCYSIRPLESCEVIFDFRLPTARRAESVDWIKALVERVSRASVEAAVEHLVAFPTRHSTSTQYLAAATWARAQLTAMGYITRLEEIRVGAGQSLNVIADIQGHGSNDRAVVVVTAHLDSINIPGGPAAPAPGADDNGSGSAGLLEIARALSGHAGLNDLRFILFGGEEEGLRGCRQYVASLSATERQRIKAVVNMDMIATVNTIDPLTVLLEGEPVSQHVIDGLADAAASYTNLAVQRSLHAARSDHVPFIRAGIPAVLTVEGAGRENRNIHSEHDTLQHINYDLLLEILRMNLAFVASVVGRH